jgi:hypothetical protein
MRKVGNPVTQHLLRLITPKSYMFGYRCACGNEWSHVLEVDASGEIVRGANG